MKAEKYVEQKTRMAVDGLTNDKPISKNEFINYLKEFGKIEYERGNNEGYDYGLEIGKSIKHKQDES